MRGNLKLSVPDWCFLKGGMDPVAYYARLKELGYDAVEMAAPANYAAIKKLGLTLLNAESPGFEKGINRMENHAELIPGIIDAIRQAASNGVRQVILFSGNREGQGDEAGYQCCLSAIKQVLPAAEAAKIELVFEMLGAADHPGYHADNSRFGFRLARELKSACFKLLYDIYHMHRMGEDVLADVTGNMDIIGHIHIAGSPKRDYPGQGQEIDYARIVPAIVKAGYKGYWGMEFLPAGDSAGELAQAADLWERLASGR